MESLTGPVAGIDYPRNQPDFDRFFVDDEACRAYLVKLRWPDGFVCPKCGLTGEPWPRSNGLLLCRFCRKETSPISGTLFQDSKKPLLTWFQAAWQVTCHKHGVSALGVQRALGLGSYEAAWSWLHKLRRAMVRPDRDRLTGVVQVDETWVSGLREHKPGRSPGSAMVAIAVEENGMRLGRIRLSRIHDASAESLVPFIQTSIEPGETVHTDGWSGYLPIGRQGYQHMITVLKGKQKGAAHELLPHVHIVASLLKRWLLGTHQGAVSTEHLDYYLDEFTFRFNRRTSNSRGLLFYRLIQNAALLKPCPQASLKRKPKI